MLTSINSRSSIVAAAAALLASTGLAFAQTPKPAAPPPAAAASAPAPVSSDPETQTATYGDWTLRCQRITDASGPKRLCEVVQSVSVKGQNSPLAQIAVGRMTASDPLRMTVVTPNDISFPSSVRVAIDEKDKEPTELAWTRCLPAGCFATGAPNAEALKRWRASTDSGSDDSQERRRTGRGDPVLVPRHGAGAGCAGEGEVSSGRKC